MLCQKVLIVCVVVTLVILIILAGVSMDMILGDKGIITRAQETANITYQTEANTQASFNSMVEELERAIEEITPPEEKSEIEKAKESGEVFEEKTPLKDKQGNVVQVPEGFKIAEDSGDTVQQGIVIEDVSASGDIAVQGSQFVWIPVGTFIKDDKTQSSEIILGRYTFGNVGTEEPPRLEQVAYTEEEPENYLKHDDIEIISSYYTELPDYRVGVASDEADGLNATAKDLAGFVSSVKTNGGYYIGRYEASFASGDSIENYKAASKVSTGYAEDSMTYTKGTLWNNISQLNASKVSINTYSGSKSVKSDLMNSYTWDTAIVYIQEAGNEDYAHETRAYNQLSNTGNLAEGIKDEVCKINDMASNTREWTTENSNNTNPVTSPCTGRGGNYEKDENRFVANRYTNTATHDSGKYRF